MGSSTSYLRLNIFVSGVTETNEEIINKLFPKALEENKRELKKDDDKIHYTARILRGQINENHLNEIKYNINRDFDDIQNKEKTFPKNVILCFTNENENIRRSVLKWVRIANKINTLPEYKVPFIVFLGYENCNNINNGDFFGNFKDKRKIAIIKLISNNNEPNDEIRKANDEVNYRKILSYLWYLAQILNQRPFNLSKNPEANFYRIREEVPAVSINILLTGFSRKGKSTFINMIFDKMITLENPNVLPVTTEINEFLLPYQPAENGIVKGGIKLVDVPGIIEGTNENMAQIQKLVEQSIENQEYNFDVFNYILFFLTPGPNFRNADNFLQKLNESRIKVIFIINRDHPRENGEPNTTKETLISYLESKRFNSLIRDNGNNILEVDLIRGVEGRINEIFRYIRNDLLNHNRFDDHTINNINNIHENELYPYLHNNFDLFSNINSTEDIIERGNRRANVIIGATVPLIIAAGFSPIPFIDIPIFLLLIAQMLIRIFKVYGITISIHIFRLFFDNYERRNRNNYNRRIEDGEEGVIDRLGLFFGNINDENIRFIIRRLIRALAYRIAFSAILGGLDFIPFIGFLIAGGINAIINTPFIYEIGKEAKTFLANKIRNTGGRQNILNILEGYRDSVSLLESLENKNEWGRKIQILTN